MSLLMTYSHALDLLSQYGVKTFYIFLKNHMENVEKKAQATKIKNDLESVKEMIEYQSLFKKHFDEK
jgi:hypothetical protein